MTTFEQTTGQRIAINNVLRLVEAARVSSRTVLREAMAEARRQSHMLTDREADEFGSPANRIEEILGDVCTPGDQGGGEIDVFFADLVKRLQDWTPDHA